MKKFILILFLSFVGLEHSFAAGGSGGSGGSGGDGGGKQKTSYDNAVTLIKSAKKLEKKDKIDKALKKYQKAQKLLVKSNKKKPNHIGINEYLGELYVATNRHNLAVERLEILKGCNCKEYEELKAIIAGEKVSKY